MKSTRGMKRKPNVNRKDGDSVDATNLIVIGLLAAVSTTGAVTIQNWCGPVVWVPQNLSKTMERSEATLPLKMSTDIW